MPYCVSNDVLLRAPQIGSDISATGQVAAGIAAAQAQIDARLENKFVVPFLDPVPALINVIATELAAGWALASVFSGNESESQMIAAQAMTDRGKKMLDEVHEGVLKLVDATSKQPIASSLAPIYVSGNPSTQLRDMDWLGFVGPRVPDNHWWPQNTNLSPPSYPW